jgi:tetratricopeptide (TPR) repeat protein
MPPPIVDLANDARSYLMSVGSDPGFTQALPTADGDESTDDIQATIDGGDVDAILTAGTAALISNRYALAQSAFAAATTKAPEDYRGPLLAGLTAQTRGDWAAARTFFIQASTLNAPAAVFANLAVADFAAGDEQDALAAARQSTSLNPNFMPGHFIAGMIELVTAQVPIAEQELTATEALPGAPTRTDYFLKALHEREDVKP